MEKRLRVGRLGAEGPQPRSRGPRPINVGAALREDPSLQLLLGLAEKLGRQNEAGFCSSGSDEVSMPRKKLNLALVVRTGKITARGSVPGSVGEFVLNRSGNSSIAFGV